MTEKSARSGFATTVAAPQAASAPLAAPATVDLDALVAQYAPLGRRLRRQRLTRRIVAALLVPVLGIAGIQGWKAVSPRLRTVLDSPAASLQATDSTARMESALAEFRDLKASVRASVAAQTRALSVQREALAARSRQFDAQQSQLADAIAKVDNQRREIEARQARAGQQVPSLDRQITREIERINAQRMEIERQRKAIEEQRAEVQGLLNRINEVGLNRLRQEEPGAPDQEPVVASVAGAGAPQQRPSGPLATLATVDTGVLGEMRGGIDTGDDFSVSIGITRSGSINGIEQFTSSMFVDDLARATGSGLPQQMEAVVLQVGTGNLIAVDSLSGLSPNVTTVIQNTLDNQAIATQTVMDISLQNVSTVLNGLSAAQVVSESLARQP